MQIKTKSNLNSDKEDRTDEKSCTNITSDEVTFLLLVLLQFYTDNSEERK